MEKLSLLALARKLGPTSSEPTHVWNCQWIHPWMRCWPSWFNTSHRPTCWRSSPLLKVLLGGCISFPEKTGLVSGQWHIGGTLWKQNLVEEARLPVSYSQKLFENIPFSLCFSVSIGQATFSHHDILLSQRSKTTEMTRDWNFYSCSSQDMAKYTVWGGLLTPGPRQWIK